MQTAVLVINVELLGAQQELSRLRSRSNMYAPPRQRRWRPGRRGTMHQRPIRHYAPWERDEQREDELDDRCSYLKAMKMAVQDSLHLFQGSPEGIELATLVVMSLAAPAFTADTMIGRPPSDMLPLLALVPWEQLLSECRSWQEVYDVVFSEFPTEVVQPYVSRAISGLLQRHSSPRLRLRPRVFDERCREELCTICFDCSSHPNVRTECGHYYHDECYSGWSRVTPQPPCPNCRRPCPELTEVSGKRVVKLRQL